MSAGALLVALLSPAVAIVIAMLGFRRASGADRLKAFFEMHERYLGANIRAGRRLLHQQIAGRSRHEIAALDSGVRDTVAHTLAVMNSIAIAVEAGYVDRKVVAESMGRSFSAAIIAAKPYIDHLEDVRGFRPYGYAERLAKRLQPLAGAAPRARQPVGDSPAPRVGSDTAPEV
jgi:hypothetical protein